MQQSFSVIIPARHASNRLPGKMLAGIAGKPMIQRVYEQAARSGASQVVVATDHEEILAAVRGFGGRACLTRDDHQSGTDRLQEAASLLELGDDHVVVNVQGDEPLIPPSVIDQVADNLSRHAQHSVATLCEAIDTGKDFVDPNVVKVLCDTDGRALYFSRAPVPWPRDAFAGGVRADGPVSEEAYRHIGIYAYRVGLLHAFVNWPPAPLETTERLEQLRVLWNGHSIHVAESVERVPGGVDTPGDLQRIRTTMESSAPNNL